MIKSKLLYLTCFILSLAPSIVLAQYTNPDTSFVQQSVSNTIALYRNTVGTEAHLYTGPEYYVPFKSYVEGHQYFQVKTFEKGNVFYDGAWFYEVPMLYDIAVDEVVTIHPGSGLSQKLVKQKVGLFELSNHTFVYLSGESVGGFSMQPGFYKLIYNGDIKAFVRHEKYLQERTSTNGLEGHYKAKDKFYLQKNGVYYQVSNKASVLKVLSDKKKELKEFSRSNKIRFRNKREEAIKNIAKHYDSLKR
ncbi:hypothetical protein [Pontibacter cellulosilyticus]|uniref:Uncharacterized protein n=1 Tax=Pontibacter cellulosilyticus TaxID=1720253 RepID=A0A923N8C7_9BACT|nr:hypothetical protein [Pontibacter cellulosilyticus]MBC5994663.1 hypothetical protein [Pontibacter cellulosilyticus]